jgi:outer membrane protein TolC
MTALNYIKRLVFLIVIILYIQPIKGRAQTIDDYLKEALENNTEVKALFSEYMAALEVVPQVGALPDPIFAFGIFISPLETRAGPGRAKFSYMQMFPWIGTQGMRKDASALEAKARYELFEEARNMLSFRVKRALFKLYELNRDIDIYQENIDALQDYQEIADSKYEVDKSKMIDVIRVQLEIIQAETDIEILKDKRRPMEVGFNNLLNREADLPIVIPGNLGINEVETRYLRDSLMNNPRIKKVDLHIQAAKIEEKIRYNEGLPKLGAGFDYLIVGKSGYEVTNNGSDAFMLKFAITIPMFRKKNDAAIREAKYLEEAYSNSKDAIRSSLLSELEDGLFMYNSAWESFKLSISEISRSGQILRLLLSGYSDSGTDFEEVLRMQRQKLQYNLKKEEAITELNIAIAKIEFLIGR